MVMGALRYWPSDSRTMSLRCVSNPASSGTFTALAAGTPQPPKTEVHDSVAGRNVIVTAVTDAGNVAKPSPHVEVDVPPASSWSAAWTCRTLPRRVGCASWPT